MQQRGGTVTEININHNILTEFRTIFISTKTKIENYAYVHSEYTKQKLGKHAYFIHANESEFTIPRLC